MKIVWSPEAADDLEAAIEYIAADNPRAAEKLANGVLRLIERLATEPIEGPTQAGRRRPDCGRFITVH